MTTQAFITLLDAAQVLARGAPSDVEIWVSALAEAANRGDLSVVRSWQESSGLAPGGFSFARAPAEWRVFRQTVVKWCEANGIDAFSSTPDALPTTVPDPERRLALLRQLGGDAKYNRAKAAWTFLGISKLVAAEKAGGRARVDEKTIRSDLKLAAQQEREDKAAGPFNGLGQR